MLKLQLVIERKLLVRGARQLLTLRGPPGPRRGLSLQDLAIISDGALLIVNGRIEDAGPSRRIENLAEARDALEINAAGKVVMPAFVDSHTQIVFAHHGVHPLGAGVFSMEGAVRAGAHAMHTVGAATLQSRAAKLTHGMVRHGTCTIEAKSGYGLDCTGELKTLRVHAALHHTPIDIVSTFGVSAIPIEYEHAPEAYLKYLRTEVLPTVSRRRLARFVDIRCGEDAFSAELAKPFLEAARRMKFGIKVHTGCDPASGAIPLAVELDAAAAGSCRHFSAADTELLARSSTVAILFPDAVFETGEESDLSPRRLIDQGGTVALASNFNPDTHPAYNMQAVISMACRHLGLTPAEAISAATINGAHAAGASRDAGTLEPGKNADLLVMNVSDYRDIGYYSGVNNVHMTVKNGVIIYKEGGIQSPDRSDAEADSGVRPKFLRRA